MFCHLHGRSTWDLLRESNDPGSREERFSQPTNVLLGRPRVEKDGTVVEDDLEPVIYIVQDDDRYVSSGIYVMGGVQIITADGEVL